MNSRIICIFVSPSPEGRHKAKVFSRCPGLKSGNFMIEDSDETLRSARLCVQPNSRVWSIDRIHSIKVFQNPNPMAAERLHTFAYFYNYGLWSAGNIWYMENIFRIHDALEKGDNSVLEMSDEDISKYYKSEITRIVGLLRQKCDPYLSEYYLNKQAIDCAFGTSALDSCSHYDLIVNRLTLVDSMYSTQMSMRPYGLGELAEVMSLFGSDDELRDQFLVFLKNHDVVTFDYLKSRMKKYCDGISRGASNLFDEGFGVEKHQRSHKKAWSLITKYAYFLTSHNFPIYDALVRKIYPRLWKKCCPGIPMPKINGTIVEYIDAIDSFRKHLGEMSYDEFDFILWHIGKIVGGSLTLILTMEDYLAMPVNYDIKTVNLFANPVISNNKLLLSLFSLAKIV